MTDRAASPLAAALGAALVAQGAVIGCGDSERLLGSLEPPGATGPGGQGSAGLVGAAGTPTTGSAGGTASSGAGGAGRGGGTGGASGGVAGGAAGTVPRGAFSEPLLVAELAGELGSEIDPALARGGLELFLASHFRGSYDLYTAVRSAVGEPWSVPVLIEELATDSDEATPEPSADGLTLYFGSDRPSRLGGSRLWVTTRAAPGSPWGVPQLVPFESYGDAENSPTVTPDGSRIAFAGRRGSETYDLYEAVRTSPSEPFGSEVALAPLNSASDDIDPAYYREGLGIFYSSKRVSLGILLEATRPSLDAPFSAPYQFDELHEIDEVDPWISSDGTQLLFGSRRESGGPSRIYESFRSVVPK